jgi:TolA-binding protein
MAGMTLGEKITLATLAVTAIGVFATWIQPVSNRSHRAAAVFVFFVLVGIGAWVGATISAVSNPVTATDGTTTAGTTSTTTTAATTSTTHTLTFAAPAEPPEKTSTILATVSGTTGTVPPVVQSQKSAPDRPPVTASTETVDRRNRTAQQWHQAMSFSIAGRWTDAVDAWRQFIREYGGHNRGTDRESFHRLGVAYESLERWNEAAAFKNATLVDDVNGATDLMHLGHCYSQLHRWPDAVNVYKRVLKIDPSNRQARNSLYWAVKQQMPD